MRRRHLLPLLLLAPRAHAQRRRHATIALVHHDRSLAQLQSDGHALSRALQEALGENGRREGANLTISRWTAGGDPARYASLCAEVVASAPDAILVSGAGLREVRAEAALMPHAPRLIPHHRLVLAAMGPAGIPLASELRLFTAGAGLFSHGADWVEVERRRARLVARILDGASPGDISIEQPTRFELVVNQQTAQRLGLPVPLAVLAFATELI